MILYVSLLGRLTVLYVALQVSFAVLYATLQVLVYILAPYFLYCAYALDTARLMKKS